MKTSDHFLVPQHTKLAKDKKKELLEKYNITLNELPKIHKDDAAIKHISVNSGDVIKVIRPSGTSGKSVYYRVVISG
ncbi:MAG: DNA-directed RNA polymerase subunit H [Nanoarchaeota archaeon]|nr:DNA-directed RNA polymerase subunit H [Nanoarchaeota archaeon]